MAVLRSVVVVILLIALAALCPANRWEAGGMSEPTEVFS
jgi:hypothetical protein